MAGPFPGGTVDLASSPYLRIRGDTAEGRLGWTVATGALDGDGRADLVLAAPWAAAAGRSAAGLFYGLRGPLPASGDWDVNTAPVALRVQGEETGAGNAGATVLLADTDGDAAADLHIGLPDSAPQGRRSVGSVYVLRGPLLASIASPTPPASATATASPTATHTATDTDTPTPTPTPPPSATPSDTPTPTATGTDPPPATATGSPSASASAAVTDTPRPVASPTRRPPVSRLYLPFATKPRRR